MNQPMATSDARTESRPAALSPGRRAMVWFAFALVLLAYSSNLSYSNLTLPPDPKAARRHWLEGVYLYRTGFDYRSLRFKEQTHARGGAFVYMSSLVPTMIAGLYSVCPTPESVFLTYRIIQLAFSAWVALLVFELSRERAGSIVGLLVTGCLMTTPCVAAQLKMLNMEFMTAAPALAAVRAYGRKRHDHAALLVTLSTLFKPTSVVLTLGLVISVVIDAVRQKPRGPRWEAIRTSGAVWILAAFAFQFALLLFADMEHEFQRPVRQ